MTPLRSLTLIFVVLCAFAFIQSVQGLKCYYCHGSGCTEGLDECPKPNRRSPNTQYFCSRGHSTKDPTDSAAKCSPGIKPTCDEIPLGREGEKIKYCLCNTDKCNGSNRLGGFSLWPLAALTPLVIYLGMGSSST